MRIKICLTALLFMIAFAATAADISFVVYSVTGLVKKNVSVKLKKGDKILENETIALADKASLVLVCSNYKVIQLNKKGSYTAKSLLAQCSQDAAGYTSSYFKYVWNEFTHPHGKPEANPGEYMKNVGAVSRGCNTVQTGVPVDTIHYLAGAVPVYWHSSYAQAVLRIYDVPADGAPIQKTVLEKDQPINMEQIAKSLPAGEYYWQVTDAEGNGCERNYLKVWDKEAYKARVEALLAGIPVSTAAETAFAKGFVLQENHFLAEALTCYTLAAKLDVKNKLYQKTLSQFYATQF